MIETSLIASLMTRPSPNGADAVNRMTEILKSFDSSLEWQRIQHQSLRSGRRKVGWPTGEAFAPGNLRAVIGLEYRVQAGFK